jgi:enoyl-CoA hydratase/carnithine racemase
MIDPSTQTPTSAQPLQAPQTPKTLQTSSPQGMPNDLPEAWVLCEQINGIGFLTLNRPKAMNALNLTMVQALQSALTAWEHDPSVMAVVLSSSSAKALCAGGDIRFFHTTATAGDDAALADFFAQEYALNLHIAQYSKPYIAVMQGVVMGGGMGIAATAQLRIVTDNSKLAMPETKIGLFPDVGGTHFLAQLRGAFGVYLGMTGAVLDAASAQFVGLADAYCPAHALDDLLASLYTQRFASGEQLVHYLRSQCAQFAGAKPPRLSTVAMQETWIAQCFGGATTIDVWAALEKAAIGTDDATPINAKGQSELGGLADWAQQVLNTLKTCSPLMLHVTQQAIARAKTLTLAQALQAEAALMKQCFATLEPVEGIRALAIDKDHRAQWLHTDIHVVPAADVTRLLSLSNTPLL